MKLYRLRIALAVTLLALAAVSAADSASAEFPASADEQRNQFISAVDSASAQRIVGISDGTSQTILVGELP
jgi:hypothetical protein